MQEIWKDIPGFEGRYAASNMGRIKSYAQILLRKDGSKRKSRGRLLRQCMTKMGYKTIAIRRDGKVETKRIHRIIAALFVDNSFGKPFVNHKNCIKTDNRAINLEWCTNDENMAHAKVNKRFKGVRGEKNHSTKLKNEDVVDIREKYRSGEYTYRDLAKAYGINNSTCYSLVNLKTWTHLK